MQTVNTDILLDDGFICPPEHINFLAKKLYDGNAEIADAAIAYLEPGGGGPVHKHTHTHNHLFIVVKGEARIEFDDKEVLIRENESYLVDGTQPHSVWNNLTTTTVMVGITLK